MSRRKARQGRPGRGWESLLTPAAANVWVARDKSPGPADDWGSVQVVAASGNWAVRRTDYCDLMLDARRPRSRRKGEKREAGSEGESTARGSDRGINTAEDWRAERWMRALERR